MGQSQECKSQDKGGGSKLGQERISECEADLTPVEGKLGRSRSGQGEPQAELQISLGQPNGEVWSKDSRSRCLAMGTWEEHGLGLILMVLHQEAVRKLHCSQLNAKFVLEGGSKWRAPWLPQFSLHQYSLLYYSGRSPSGIALRRGRLLGRTAAPIAYNTIHNGSSVPGGSKCQAAMQI